MIQIVFILITLIASFPSLLLLANGSSSLSLTLLLSLLMTLWLYPFILNIIISTLYFVICLLSSFLHSSFFSFFLFFLLFDWLLGLWWPLYIIPSFDEERRLPSFPPYPRELWPVSLRLFLFWLFCCLFWFCCQLSIWYSFSPFIFSFFIILSFILSSLLSFFLSLWFSFPFFSFLLSNNISSWRHPRHPTHIHLWKRS